MIFTFYASTSQLHPGAEAGKGRREAWAIKQYLVWESSGGGTEVGSTIPKPQQYVSYGKESHLVSEDVTLNVE